MIDFPVALALLQEPSFNGTSSKSATVVGVRNTILPHPLCTLIEVFPVGVPIAHKLTRCPIRLDSWDWDILAAPARSVQWQNLPQT
jgi:hypothetical protein